jgi:hypothetical protein
MTNEAHTCRKVDALLRMQTAYDIVETPDGEGDLKIKRHVAKARPRTGDAFSALGGIKLLP